MISFTVRMRFDPRELDEMRTHLEALAHASRQEPGCVSYIPHFLADDPSTVLIYEQYRDDAALDAHRASAHFAQHAIGGLYQGMKDRHVESLHAVA